MARAIVVSGGTSGIGRATALKLAQTGDAVLALGIDEQQHVEMAQECATAGLDITLVRCDVSRADQVEPAIADFIARHSCIDGLVNAAAVVPVGTILDVAEDVWDRTFEVNARGLFLVTRAVLPTMIKQQRGAIVNVGSGAGYGKPGPRPGFAYSVSRSLVPCFSATLALDYAIDHVRVNTVIAGGAYPTAGNRGLSPEAAARVGERMNVAGRWSDPDEIAEAICWLLSDSAATTSGAELHVGTMPRVDSGVPDPTRLAAMVEESKGKRYTSPPSYQSRLGDLGQSHSGAVLKSEVRSSNQCKEE